MSFISTAAHQKFILQCHTIMSAIPDNGELTILNDGKGNLKSDLTELEKLMEVYLNLLAEIPKATCRYYNLHRQIRINMRKLQLKKNRRLRRKLKLK